MDVLILGGDGYLGWATAKNLAIKGHNVVIVDNYSKRRITEETGSEPLVVHEGLHYRCKKFYDLTGKEIDVVIGDITNYEFLDELFRWESPDAIIHYGEQPSGPYSLMSQKEGAFTLTNNLLGTHNILWAMLEHNRDCHLIKLGTAGEYGTPNTDIPEGWFEYEYKGRKDIRLFPREAGSLYHTTKVLDTDLIWFFVRMFDLKVTDLMQGPVYGIYTGDLDEHDDLLTSFHYDDMFGTIVNRFVVQTVMGVPLTVYGKGNQTRGYLNIKDTLQCVDLVLNNPPKKGELNILNQITEQFSVNELAYRVQKAGKIKGYDVEIESIPNPRREAEDHYYNMETNKFKKLGLKPHLMDDETLVGMIEYVEKYSDNIEGDKIFPRVTWHK